MSVVLRIRAARADEYAAIGVLTADSYAQVLADGEDDPYRADLLDAQARAENAELLVALDGDKLAGTVTIGRPGSSYAEVAHGDELEVRMLAVAPEYARQGVGGQLMARVHQIAEVEGFQALVLSVISSNKAALAFYDHLGYERQPTRDWLPRDDMELHLLVLTRQVKRSYAD
ncbi:MAG: GNAT family N-acetyltransferase [Candidatus Nanopelagicales bacterium]